MGADTKIQWCDATLNPWIGCTKVSPGCKNCYAETCTPVRAFRIGWGAGAPRWRVKSFAAAARAANRKAGRLGRRLRVFPSLCDWLDMEVAEAWLADFVTTIAETPELDWLLLTKRPQVWRARMVAVRHVLASREHAGAYMLVDAWLAGSAPANVWIGVSIEDQARAEQRMPELVEIPARVRFLSCEPLIGGLDLNYWLTVCLVPQVQWVIVGGESGAGARPCDAAWVESIIEQCAAVRVSCFVKQLGARAYRDDLNGREAFIGIIGGKLTHRAEDGQRVWAKWKHSKGGDSEEWAEVFRVREFPGVRS
ncbi:MAG: DUF5131 family protein [Candidatus Didemnitutus sp.]|nr:DUF5131 family protein [Candidatus Didemnitutus sp.]